MTGFFFLFLILFLWKEMSPIYLGFSATFNDCFPMAIVNEPVTIQIIAAPSSFLRQL